MADYKRPIHFSLILPGTALCQNSPVDPVLLQLVHQELNFLQDSVDKMCVENEEEKTKIVNALRTFKARLEELEKKMEKMESWAEDFVRRQDDFEGALVCSFIDDYFVHSKLF